MTGIQTPGTKNQEATVYIGNLDEKVNESILTEIMVQMGPIKTVNIPRDRVSNQHQGFAFCEFRCEEDAEYAIKILNGTRIWGKACRLNKSSQDKRTLDVGANVFIGNLHGSVDEKLLLDTFHTFGTMVSTPKVARDENGESKGYGFISYDCFEASDRAIEAMNGQFLCNQQITLAYAFKKDGKGERHGGAAERLVAEKSRKLAIAEGLGAGLSSSTTNITSTSYSQYPNNVPSSSYYAQ